MSVLHLHPWAVYLSHSWKSAGIVALCVLAGLLALALWAGCVWAAWLYLRKKQQVTFPLVLTSRSNVHTHFQLRLDLDGLEKRVKAFWVQEGEPLAPATLKQYSYEQEALPETAPAAAPGRSKKIALPAKETKKAKEGLKKANAVTSAVAGISGVLAGLLPGAMKTPFREVNTAIRAQQQKVSGVKADVNHVQSSTRSLNADVKRLGDVTGVKPGSGPRGTGGESQGKPAEVGQRLVVQEIPIAETDVFEPGENGTCSLVIRPMNPLRKLEGAFKVTAQPVEIKEFPLYAPLPVQTLSAGLKIQPVILQHVLFTVLTLAVGALCAWGAGALIGWLWLFRV